MDTQVTADELDFVNELIELERCRYALCPDCTGSSLRGDDTYVYLCTVCGAVHWAGHRLTR